MKFCSVLLTAALALFVLAQSAIAQPITVTVQQISDGDTFTATNGQTIRLACIDAMEGQQSGGAEARQQLSELIPPGATVRIIPVDIDQYDRTVAVVFANNERGQQTNVNLFMVREGQAAVYTQYLDNCPSSRQDLLDAQEIATRERLGIWSQSRPCMPWDFRAGRCGAAAVETPTRNNCDPSYPDVCIPPAPPDLDCSDISERRFQVVGADPHGFDSDRDGIGCER